LAGLEIDLYGNREDSDQVKEAGNKLKLVVRVHPDVVCTTTAEALAMGKIVICANHPSNDFFKQFSNCRTYDDGNGFIEATRNAEPAPLTDALRRAFGAIPGSLYPDEEQCKELGLFTLTGRVGSKKDN
ncbi:hypothetical protein Gohar_004702, partial [Gossypium harknessii]|nr:hypothetical protein [Gossypium harknessii]